MFITFFFYLCTFTGKFGDVMLTSLWTRYFDFLSFGKLPLLQLIWYMRFLLPSCPYFHAIAGDKYSEEGDFKLNYLKFFIFLKSLSVWEIGQLIVIRGRRVQYLQAVCLPKRIWGWTVVLGLKGQGNLLKQVPRNISSGRFWALGIFWKYPRRNQVSWKTCRPLFLDFCDGLA